MMTNAGSSMFISRTAVEISVVKAMPVRYHLQSASPPTNTTASSSKYASHNDFRDSRSYADDGGRRDCARGRGVGGLDAGGRARVGRGEGGSLADGTGGRRLRAARTARRRGAEPAHRI